MKSIMPKVKTPEPSEAELALKDEQLKEIAKRNRDLDAEQARQAQSRMDAAAAATEEQTARAGNRLGSRSLLSGDWAGFRRGGDMGAR
jgi:hypothetical protein